MTQSEYVKEELIHLRQSLQELEDRAGTIETDIRNAMSEGTMSCAECHYGLLIFPLSQSTLASLQLPWVLQCCLYVVHEREQE